MKSVGGAILSAGVESGSNKILKLMNKRTTAEQIKKFTPDELREMIEMYRQKTEELK